MEHADPWDEIVRLEKQMEVELLSRLERTRTREADRLPIAERLPADRTRPDPKQ